jgi:hypothetical protein
MEPLARVVQGGFDEGVLAADVTDDIVTVTERKALLQRSVLGGTVRMRAQVIAKRELVGYVRMSESTDVHLMGPYAPGVLAEVKAPWSAWNFGAQTLSSNSISQAFHGASETIDGRGFAQDHEHVDDGLCREARNRRAPDVVNSRQHVGEQVYEGAGLASEGLIPGRIVLDNFDRARHSECPHHRSANMGDY